MFRIRFHGRGGQGMKTASHILGKAFFKEGYEVQDAPRYGAERRGAPMSAYVRAAAFPINERGVVNEPACVVVADETLIPIPAAEILKGCTGSTVVLIRSSKPAAQWAKELNTEGPVICLPEITRAANSPLLGGMACIGAVAGLSGVISKGSLKSAICEELHHLDKKTLDQNIEVILEAYEKMADSSIKLSEAEDIPTEQILSPKWINLALDDAEKAAPAIYAATTSANIKTGLWRSVRPEIEYEQCNRCWWLCSTFCPEGAIHMDEEHYPRIDYDHCKGCLICMNQCPTHAIQSFPEHKDDRAAKEVS